MLGMFGSPMPFEACIRDEEAADNVDTAIALFRAAVEDLARCNVQSSEAVEWLTAAQSSFTELCEAFGADATVIRRELARKAHRELLFRVHTKNPNWVKVVQWYTGYPATPRFTLDHLAALACITPQEMRKDILAALDTHRTPAGAATWRQAA